MTNQIQIRVDESLKEILEKVRIEIADNLKKTYRLNEVTISGTLTSQIVAAKLQGKKTLNFKIRKCGLSKGIIELL